MKNFLLVCAFLMGIFQLQAQNYCMTTPQGFGAGTTGGGDATPTVVTTYDDLKTAITTSGDAVIIVSGEITVPEGGMISAVITNKTILGLPGAKLINENQTSGGPGILYIKTGSKNVIIRNLIFVGPGAYDIDGNDNMTVDGCVGLWVDHCEFQDGQDGNFDNKGKTDNVTISWCKFTYLKDPVAGGSGGSDDHRYTNLVGSSKTDAPADGHFSITFQCNYWADGCRERMPRARNAELHILNCYYNTDVSSSTAIGLGGGTNNSTCYVEGTNFASIGTVYKSYTSTDGGTVAVNFVNCLNGKSNVGTVTVPDYNYNFIPVDSVEAAVTNASCGAGATLLVTSDGEISTSCDVPSYFTLSKTTSGDGSGSIKLSPAGGIYEDGTEVTITATADDNSTFDSWSGDLSGTTNPATVIMTADKSINAVFNSNTVYYTLTTSTSGNGTGSVELSPAGGTYEAGTEVTVTAVPANDGSVFDSWSGDYSGTTNPTTITLNSDMSIEAIFTNNTAIKNKSSNTIAIFPTVVDKTFYIQVPDQTSSNMEVQIISISGKIVYYQQKEVVAGTAEINPGSLVKGVYFCKVQLGNTIKTQKIIKQ